MVYTIYDASVIFDNEDTNKEIRMSPSYEEFLQLKEYLVIRPNGTINFKQDINKFHTKKSARLTPERRITWDEFLIYYTSIIYVISGVN